MFFVLSQVLDKENILSPAIILAVCSTCIMNFVMGLAHHRVSVAQWQRIWARIWGSEVWFLCCWLVGHQRTESKGLRCNSSLGLGIFSLSHASDKSKNIFVNFLTELKTYNFSLSFYDSSYLTADWAFSSFWATCQHFKQCVCKCLRVWFLTGFKKMNSLQNR